ncbi:Trypsin-like peptidase domain-containing protein [Paenibacillus sp. UNCCL117]|uniref:S1 family peptidase n=1 Tax=unclassified Paenibacillus TaxID=185978 RepID=UPI000888233E|nr:MULTISPECIES: serine protease [unclassified Paenibacillus]SDD59453.1 Trypsin-like peptidase domain-containing protein [Paenibacillus sp. cl123]SFW50814.1 Trypsin-like peptidase domain-containing protein [Paenibacillus sp. UNCCL117]
MSMIRKLAIVGFLISLLSGAAVWMHAKADTPAVYNAEDTFSRSEDALMYLRILREDDSLKATGTGVILSADGRAATAYHVVKGAERIEGTLRDGRVVSPIQVIGYDEQTDAALLQLPDPKDGKKKLYDYLPIRETAVNYGEQVFALGYPMADTPIITEGIVNNPKAEVNGRSRILTSAQVASGMSGGPVIDRFGRVTGIISGSLRTMNNIHLVIDMEDIRSLMLGSSK